MMSRSKRAALRTHHFSIALCMLAAVCLVRACRSTPPQPAAPPPVSADTYATVNGTNITRDEVEKAFRQAATLRRRSRKRKRRRPS
jgi:hypothetical protein